jgi:hypothetical protein
MTVDYVVIFGRRCLVLLLVRRSRGCLPLGVQGMVGCVYLVATCATLLDRV